MDTYNLGMAPESQALLTRLEMCVARAGSKRALAGRSGISEAQLYRYLGGESVLPSDRLMAIATAAAVDSAWLLTGDGPMHKPLPDPRPGFDPALLQNIVREFSSLLQEYEVRYTPELRAKAVAVLYEAARLARQQEVVTDEVTRLGILHQLDFLGHEQRNDIIACVNEAMAYLEYGRPHPPDHGEWQDWLNRFDTLMAIGHANMYNAYSGELYFARMSGPLPERAVKRVLELVSETRLLTGTAPHKPLHWLEAGCGNGRELSFLYRHAQPVEVKGVEPTRRGLDLCRQVMGAHKLPDDCVVQGDLRNLPAPNASQHMVYCKMRLSRLPYIAGSGVGLEAFMAEAARVLVPGGLAYLVASRGHGRVYLPFFQRLTVQGMHEAAAHAGFKVVRDTPADTSKSPAGSLYDTWHEYLLQKL